VHLAVIADDDEIDIVAGVDLAGGAAPSIEADPALPPGRWMRSVPPPPDRSLMPALAT
jgi:hypothetical protein